TSGGKHAVEQEAGNEGLHSCVASNERVIQKVISLTLSERFGLATYSLAINTDSAMFHCQTAVMSNFREESVPQSAKAVRPQTLSECKRLYCRWHSNYWLPNFVSALKEEPSSHRFAPHLEKCMGMGRNSSR
uniref:SAGA-associated factor 11 n=1 Tax=Parascaris equorum TaxID=6256 RepID=A0A914SBH6_PAREQ